MKDMRSFFVVGFAAASLSPASAALVAYFPLDGPEGATVSEIVPTIDDPNHGVTTGVPNNNAATWVNDATRGSVLNSPDGNRFLAGTQSIDLTTGFTWSFWAKVDPATGGSDAIVGTRNGSWHKITPASGVDGTGFVDFTYSGGLNLADGMWHHYGYVGTDNGTANPGTVTVTLYIDGSPVGTDTTAGSLTYEGQMEIGGSTRFSEFATVLLDDLAIWNSALSESEIQTLAAGGPIPEPSSSLLLGLGLAALSGFRRRGRN
jgi:hypothetical protein